MQILSQGEYVGDILGKVQQHGIYASVSAYNKTFFYDDWHCHENAHISFVLKGGCSEKKKKRMFLEKRSKKPRMRGFFDQSHFIRIFKELTGYLPAQYQKI